MLYQAFREQWLWQGCVSVHQIYAWHPGFDKNNLVRWVKQGLLTKLKNGLYTFPECSNEIGFSYFAAGCIYKPSYVSLHAALAFYGLIPEAVTAITSVTTRKTSVFENATGSYMYKSIKSELFFGFELLTMADKRTFKMALPEKAIIDMLYLYPFYHDKSEIAELRFDNDLLHELIQIDTLNNFADKTGSKALSKRMNIFIEVYDL